MIPALCLFVALFVLALAFVLSRGDSSQLVRPLAIAASAFVVAGVGCAIWGEQRWRDCNARGYIIGNDPTTAAVRCPIEVLGMRSPF